MFIKARFFIVEEFDPAKHGVWWKTAQEASMRFKVKFWWTNSEELRVAHFVEDDSIAELAREHFWALLEQGAFGDKVDVRFDLHNGGGCIIATVEVDVDMSQSDFMQQLFNRLATWVIGEQK